MYAFNSAAIFYPGHPYIESTTVLSDTYAVSHSNLFSAFRKEKQQYHKSSVENHVHYLVLHHSRDTWTSRGVYRKLRKSGGAASGGFSNYTRE